MQVLETITHVSFKNILFLTDFSEASEGALSYAMGLARHYKAELFPANACDPIILSEAPAANVVEEVLEHNRQKLETLVKDKDIIVHPLFAHGNIESVLQKWIQQNAIDLVVIGTHGRRGVSRFVLGSTAEFVFRNTSCPVLTVGPRVTVRPFHGFTADTVMFPTDLSPIADFAAGYALSLAKETHGRVILMHVVKPNEAFHRDAALVPEATKKLEQLIPGDAKEWCKPELMVKVGDPELEVLGCAEKERPDLIVLGLPKNKQFSSHFAAGVTYRLVSSAPCPVLTVREL